jgi:predicted transcriptional regulator
MSKDAVFTMKLEPELRDAFMAQAEALDRPASQIIREFMREFVEQQKQAKDYDAWFRAEVRQGLREADDPNTQWVTHEEVKTNMAVQRVRLLARLKAQS